MTEDTTQIWEDIQEAFIRDAIVNGIGIFIAMHKDGKTKYKLVHRSEFEQFGEFLLEYPELMKQRGEK
jgi:hypothetical protein